MNHFKPILLFSICALLFAVGCTSEDVANSNVQPEASPAQQETNPVESTESSENKSAQMQDDMPAQTVANLKLREKSVEQPAFEQTPVSNLPAEKQVIFEGPDVFLNAMRQWRDASNSYSTNAELLEVLMNQRRVRLLKENGVSVVVDYERLSTHDKNFVREFILFHRNQDVSPTSKLVVE